MTVTVYAPGSSPKAIAGAQRVALALPSGITPVIAFSINAGPLLKPLKVSFANPGPAAGSIYRLAGYGTHGFRDVDTVTWAAGGSNVGVATEDNNANYAQASLAVPFAGVADGTLYAFYIVPSATAAHAPTFVVNVSGPTALEAGATATYTSSEDDGNGFPILPAPTLTFSTTAGTIDPNTGAFQSAPVDTTGTVTATDSSRSLTGTLAVKVSSARPATSTDAFTYTGTLTTTLTANLAPVAGATTAPVTQVTSAAVTQNIVSGGSTDGVNFGLTTSERDDESLRSTTTTTVTNLAYVAAAPGYIVHVTQQSSTDSNGVTYKTNYGGGSGAVAVLPEANGTVNNTGQSVYTETDPGNIGPGGVSTTRTTAADGSYTQSSFMSGNGTDTYQQGNDGTGVAKVGGGTTEYDFLPVTTVAGNTFVPINVFSVNTGTGVKTPSPPQRQAYPWYGSTVPAAPLVTDSVTTTTGSALDVSCPTTATFTANGKATATLVTETYHAYDFVLGQIETRTMKSYDIVGPGTICIVLSDRIDTWYDYSGQEGNTIQKRPTVATPYQTTVVAETLGQVSSPTLPTSTTRSTKSVGSRVNVSAAVRARFQHVVEKARADQTKRLSTLMRNTRGTN